VELGGASGHAGENECVNADGTGIRGDQTGGRRGKKETSKKKEERLARAKHGRKGGFQEVKRLKKRDELPNQGARGEKRPRQRMRRRGGKRVTCHKRGGEGKKSCKENGSKSMLGVKTGQSERAQKIPKKGEETHKFEKT